MKAVSRPSENRSRSNSQNCLLCRNFCRQGSSSNYRRCMQTNGGHLKKLAAGLFFIIGVGLIALSVFFIGLDRGLTQPKFHVLALFNQVGGLVEGSPIRISGVDVGIVGTIDFLSQPIEGRSLKVRLDIFKKY